MLTHPVLVAGDLCHYSSWDPLINMDSVAVVAVLDSTLVTPPGDPGAFSIVSASGVDCLQLQSVAGAVNPTYVRLAVGAGPLSVDFDLEPLLLPELWAGSYFEVTLISAAQEARVRFSQLGIAIGSGTSFTAVPSSASIATGRQRYRIRLDAVTSRATLYTLSGQVTQLASWLLGTAGGPNQGVHITCYGMMLDPVAVHLFELRAVQTSADPVFPTANVVNSTGLIEAGTLQLLSGATSVDPGGGGLTYRWRLRPPPTSDSEMLESAQASAAIATPLGKTATFSILGKGLEGNDYFLVIQNGALALSVTDNVIQVTYPPGTLFETLRLTLASPEEAAYNPTVSALLALTTSDSAVDLPLPGIWTFSGGMFCGIVSAVVFPDVIGTYLVDLFVQGTEGLWDATTYAMAVEPVSVLYGTIPDVSFLKNQISRDFWRGMENHLQIEQAWSAGASVLASDLLDTFQTKLTRIFDEIPEFWRKRWLDLPMWVDFSHTIAVTLPTASLDGSYALHGVAVPRDDYDSDVLCPELLPAWATVYLPVTITPENAGARITLPDGATWEAVPHASVGMLFRVSTTIYHVTAMSGIAASATLVSGPLSYGLHSSFSLKGLPLGNIAGTSHTFLATIQTSTQALLGSPQDVIPSMESLGPGGAYARLTEVLPASFVISLDYGTFPLDARVGDVLMVAGFPWSIVAVSLRSVTVAEIAGIESALIPAIPGGLFSWEVRRPITQITWDAVGSVDLSYQSAVFHVGDLLRVQVSKNSTVETTFVPIRYVNGSVYYMSVQELSLQLTLLRSSLSSATVVCSGALRTDRIPLPETAYHVPVLRVSLLVDAPAMCINEDYQVENGEVLLETPYTSTNLPPRTLWAENMLLHNSMAADSFGELVGVTLDTVQDKAWLVPTIRSIWDQMMYGPWKNLMERSLRALAGLPFAKEQGRVSTVDSGWVTIAGVHRSRVYATPDSALYNVGDFIPEFASLGSHLSLVDRVDNTGAWQAYVSRKGTPDVWHDFLVHVPHTAASGIKWGTLTNYLATAKPIWTNYQLGVRITLDDTVTLADELQLKIKKYLFDVITACVYPDAPMTMGMAYMLNDPVYPKFTEYDCTATGGGNTWLECTGDDFVVRCVKRGCVVINRTINAYGWVTAVTSATRVEVEYGMIDVAGVDTVVNSNTDDITMIWGGSRLGILFGIPLRLTGIAGTDATNLLFTPSVVGVDFKNQPVTKDALFYGIEQGWSVINRSVPGVLGVVAGLAGVDHIALDGLGIVGSLPGDVFELVPPTGIGTHAFGSPEIGGPAAHPFMKVAFYDIVTGSYLYLVVVPLLQLAIPIPPGLASNPIPVVCAIPVASGIPGALISLVGHFLRGVTTVTVGAAPVVPASTADALVTFNVPVLPPGVYDISVTDPNGTWLRSNGFTVL